MNEEAVAAKFAEFLESNGYVVKEQDIHSRTKPDIVAEKDGKTLIAQLKGTPPKPEPRVDFGTAILQIMKFMHKESDSHEYVIGISDIYVNIAKQCKYPLRKLGIRVYVVKADDVSLLF